MEVMGFDERWIKLIMTCVTTVSYNVMVNGVSGGRVQPTRGLRQGDPLPPFLFIICVEGLSMLLQKALIAGSIHRCRVARGAPPISHLFFADDSLLFFKANIQEASVVKQCLARYEELSGQLVNYHKSNICFSRNTGEAMREEVAACLGVDQARNFGKYLGLPSFIGRNKRVVFSYVEDKIRQRVTSWNKKLLLQAGKKVFLKSVAQSMPTFSMSVFFAPRIGLHIYTENNEQDLRAFNLAMLGKQAWCFLTDPGSLAARVYKARYYPKTSVDATI
ncbi:PREDICTED: uncharacterized protein LOC109174390 [Ipomoea nil]|uniref:uncharacterized protein LOC109174390 n=1 Tax=Ipomoea nil TaxID=35883 RepID=UPI0009017375|nr:PREDICTED: uncharacterized protein LOC109174390 [Ipomoea nil]